MTNSVEIRHTFQVLVNKSACNKQSEDFQVLRLVCTYASKMNYITQAHYGNTELAELDIKPYGLIGRHNNGFLLSNTLTLVN